ncbi:O-antigen ligase [Enterovibrio norvegicus FF-454]|uniref:O-antigen ligase n=1 Tax=Enterovibrio norvegicus FF-454 TaxID=1185651 RepID=A0A1E5C6M1_9GAMM|nr:O-antigen ligase family protein [Enterovibrio norvegicus]OEE61115.1 O-antigen ligase [Enterovibrio norvegicus FF-454]
MMNPNSSKTSLAQVKRFLETVFLISPLAVMLVSIFNFVDTKWVLSRVIPLVCVYCFVFYRDAIKQNWNTSSLKPLLVTSLLAFLYFTLMHLLRGDQFGFSRTLLTSLVYLALVPWSRVSPNLIKWFLVIAAVVCGLNAGYEYVVMGIERVGIATNPIPYALYCAVLALVSLNFILSEKQCCFRLFATMGLISATAALFLTDVRGVLLFFPLVTLYLVFCLLPSSRRHSVVTLLLVLVAIVAGYFSFQDKIDLRIQQTAIEFQDVANGHYGTSTGIRLSLWMEGMTIAKHHLFFGVGDKELSSNIEKMENHAAAVQPHLHNQYIDTLSRYGVFGLVILLIWLVSPLFSIKPAGAVGLQFDPLLSSIVLMIALAGLTDVPFHHTHLVYLFTLMSGVLLFTRAPSVKDTDLSVKSLA